MTYDDELVPDAVKQLERQFDGYTLSTPSLRTMGNLALVRVASTHGDDTEKIERLRAVYSRIVKEGPEPVFAQLIDEPRFKNIVDQLTWF